MISSALDIEDLQVDLGKLAGGAGDGKQGIAVAIDNEPVDFLSVRRKLAADPGVQLLGCAHAIRARGKRFCQREQAECEL